MVLALTVKGRHAVATQLLASCPQQSPGQSSLPHPRPPPSPLPSCPPLCSCSVVSRRQLAAQAAVAKRLAAAAERGGYGMPEASLREAHRQLAAAGEVGDYSRIFSPEEVADILAGAPPALPNLLAGLSNCAGCILSLTPRAQVQSP